VTPSSEVAAAAEPLGDLRAGQLVDRQTLRPWTRELDDRAVRDLEARGDRQVCDGRFEVRDAIDEHRLVALEMTGQEQRGRISGEANHRDPRLERLDREDQVRAEPLGEVSDVGLDVAAREVDEVEAVEQGAQAIQA
jgi:hypothetical protein